MDDVEQLREPEDALSIDGKDKEHNYSDGETTPSYYEPDAFEEDDYTYIKEDQLRPPTSRRTSAIYLRTRSESDPYLEYPALCPRQFQSRVAVNTSSLDSQEDADGPPQIPPKDLGSPSTSPPLLPPRDSTHRFKFSSKATGLDTASGRVSTSPVMEVENYLVSPHNTLDRPGKSELSVVCSKDRSESGFVDLTPTPPISLSSTPTSSSDHTMMLPNGGFTGNNGGHIGIDNAAASISPTSPQQMTVTSPSRINRQQHQQQPGGLGGSLAAGHRLPPTKQVLSPPGRGMSYGAEAGAVGGKRPPAARPESLAYAAGGHEYEELPYTAQQRMYNQHTQKKFSDVSEDDMSGDLSPALRHHRPGHPVVPPLEKMPSRVDSMDYLDHHDGNSTTRKNNTVYEMERRDDDRVFFVKDEGGSKEELLNRARQQRRCNYSLCLCLLIVSLVSLATLGVLVVNFTSPETFSQSVAKAQTANGTVSADEFAELKAELNRLKQQNALLSSNLSQLTESFSTLKMDSESTMTALRSASMRISQLNQTIEGQESRYDPSQCIFRSRSEEDDLRGLNSTSPLAPSRMDPKDHVITSVSCTSENVYAVQLMNIDPPNHVYRCWCGENRIESSSLKRICTINYLLCPSSSLALTAP